jgi:hypothetical protein
MSRWHDRSRSSQWCSDKADFPMGTYLYEMPGGDRIQRFARSVHTNYWEGVAGYFNRPEYEGMKDFGPVGGGKAKISHQITPLFTKVVVEAECPTRNVPHRRSGDAQRYRTTFVNYRDERDLHVNVSLTGKRSTYAAEAGYAFFPIAGDEPYVLIDRIAHYIHPEDDLAANVNAAHMAVHRGVRVEQSQAGLNFYPLHTPLISFGKPGAYCFDSNSKINTGIMYANLFNNCWGTNFAQWQGGDFSYDFVLRPTGNDDWDGGLARGGAEVYRPLVAQVVRGRSSTPSRSLLQIDPPSVQLVALKPAEFESGFVIRLWNADVDSVRAKIRLADEHSRDSIFRCDLLERAQGKPVAAGRGDGTTVKLAGNEIATFLLKPQRSSARPAARLAVR